MSAAIVVEHHADRVVATLNRPEVCRRSRWSTATPWAAAPSSSPMLNEVMPAEEILLAGHRWADRITRRVPLAVRLTKSVFHAPREAHPLVDDLAQAVLFETDEKYERMTAFLERKKTP